MGETNCGTQLKLSAVLTGIIFLIIAYKWIINEQIVKCNFLHLVGDCSFGIYFSHIIIMKGLNIIPGYSKYAIYPCNAIIAVMVSLLFVIAGKKILGRYSKFLGFA